jgi:hypothetical protein
MSYDAVVFRGAVIERKMLPSRDDMRGRRRYSITFRVEEYWKGSPVLEAVGGCTTLAGYGAPGRDRTIAGWRARTGFRI